MKTQKLYLLTLTMDGANGEVIGKILLADNNLDLVIRGINKIETNNNDGEYYQAYAKNASACKDPTNVYSGTYKDGVRWVDMSWDIDEIEVLS